MRAHSVFYRGGMGLCVLIFASVSIHRGIASQGLRSTQQARYSVAQAGAVLAPANNPAVLFSEDFEDGLAEGWDYDPARWSIIADNITGSQVWSTACSGTAFANSGEKDWGDYRLMLQVRRLNSDANLYFRRRVWQWVRAATGKQPRCAVDRAGWQPTGPGQCQSRHRRDLA